MTANPMPRRASLILAHACLLAAQPARLASSRQVPRDSDSEAVRMVNNNDFALGSCVWSGSQSRARNIARQLDAGMSAINDLGGTTYMSQSLPFGGCKRSGFDRFAGPEGLRGLCYPHVYSEDWVPFMKTALPPLLQYPATGKGFDFAANLISMTYGAQRVA